MMQYEKLFSISHYNHIYSNITFTKKVNILKLLVYQKKEIDYYIT